MYHWNIGKSLNSEKIVVDGVANYYDVTEDYSFLNSTYNFLEFKKLRNHNKKLLMIKYSFIVLFDDICDFKSKVWYYSVKNFNY